MPPKRKRADDALAEAPRATRTSSRLKNTASTSTTNDDKEDAAPKGKPKASKTAKAKDGGTVEAEPAPKKSRKTAAKAPAATKEADAGLNAPLDTAPSNGTAARTSKATRKQQPTTQEPYSEDKARELFKAYEDKDTPGEIGPEGFETLCTELDISLEGALPLLLAWQMHATEMAKFKDSEWMQGTGELRVSSLQTMSRMLRDLEDLLLLDKPPLQPSGRASAGGVKQKGVPVPDPYDRQKYIRYATDKNKAFGELYAFCFALAKPPSARNIDMETASAFWSVLVVPRYDVMGDIVDFINEKGSYKGVNKDLWNMVLEFCRTVQPDLSNYEADGAWPTFIDEFVAWKKSKMSEPEPKADPVDN